MEAQHDSASPDTPNLQSSEQDALHEWAASHADELCWPLFTRQELAALRFLVFRLETGRIPAAGPVSAKTEALCGDLLRGSSGARPELWSWF